LPLGSSSLSNEVDSTDVLNLDASFNLIGNSGSQSSGTYSWKNSRGECYSRTIKSASQVLTSVTTKPGCFAHNQF